MTQTIAFQFEVTSQDEIDDRDEIAAKDYLESRLKPDDSLLNHRVSSTATNTRCSNTIELSRA